jgi:hypothetical protein
MPRAPKVTSSSSQGVSRRAYQTAYAMGMHGTGSPSRALASISTGKTGTGVRSSRDYTKASLLPAASTSFGYSEREFKTPNLDALKAVGSLKPPKVKF